jgi:hypothetical protein
MMRLIRLAMRRWVRNGLILSSVLAWGRPGPVPLSIGDQVTVPGNLPGTGDAVVVARGGTPLGTCVYDLLRKGRGTLDIGELVPKSGCASDVLLFAQGGAMTTKLHAWLTGPDLVSLPSPGSLVTVPYSMVLVATGSAASLVVGTDTATANRLFDQNRTGLAFHTSRIIMPKGLSPKDVQTIGDRCDKAALDVLAQQTKLYDSTRLNVYFVPGLSGWRGRTCFAVGYSNVIFISVAGNSPATLAHELGHALGLRDLPDRKPLGHTGALNKQRIPGFVYQNVMWTGLYDQQAKEQWHFSIGQGYRMNMDQISWVIRAGVVPGRAGLACHPTGSQDSIPCPILGLDTVALTS